MDLSHLVLSHSPVLPTTTRDVPLTTTFIPYIPKTSAPSLCDSLFTSNAFSALTFRPASPQYSFPDVSAPFPSTQITSPAFIPSISELSAPSLCDSPFTPNAFSALTFQPPSPQYIFPDISAPFPSTQITCSALPLPNPQSDSLPAASSPTPISHIVPSLPSSARPSVPILNAGFVDTGGATSFAQRHPFKDVQTPCFRVRGSKSDVVNARKNSAKQFLLAVLALRMMAMMMRTRAFRYLEVLVTLIMRKMMNNQMVSHEVG
jgi:hypothetical protein